LHCVSDLCDVLSANSIAVFGVEISQDPLGREKRNRDNGKTSDDVCSPPQDIQISTTSCPSSMLVFLLA
jgi:hypothetical protein